MKKCPFCDSDLKAIETVVENVYVGGCSNENCPVIFRTKKAFKKLEACMTIYDLVKNLERR